MGKLFGGGSKPQETIVQAEEPKGPVVKPLAADSPLRRDRRNRGVDPRMIPSATILSEKLGA
jgi:hypothetical protein